MSNFDRVMAVIWVIGFFGFGPFLIHRIFGWTCTIGFAVFLFILVWLGYINAKYQKGLKGSIGNVSWVSGWSDGSYSWDDGYGGDCGWDGGYGGDCGGGDGGGDCGGGGDGGCGGDG